jgi:hypothetical protein
LAGFTQGQLDNLEAAIVSGALSVAYEGKSTTFRSLDEMLRLRSLMRAALGLTNLDSTAYAAHDRGY